MRKRRSGEEGEEGDGGVREAGRSEGGREGPAGRQTGWPASERVSDDKVRVTACCGGCFRLSTFVFRHWSYLYYYY